MVVSKRANGLIGFAILGSMSASYALGTAVASSSLFLDSTVGFNQNTASGNDDLDQHTSTDGSATSAAVTNQMFTGLDRNGNLRTMSFSGVNQVSGGFTNMHLYASGTVTNNYYNPANPPADNGSGTYNLATGSPDGFYSLGFAIFTDTLQFGGALQAGYQAKYIFHVDGTNSGDGGKADLGVDIAGNDEGFFAFDNGPIDTYWVTQSYAIDGTTPQSLRVQFSNQFTMSCFDFADGATVTGTSDFSSTLTFTGIEVVDADGNPVSGVTVSSGSGTQYAILVPEPTKLAILLPGVMAVMSRRRMSAK